MTGNGKKIFTSIPFATLLYVTGYYDHNSMKVRL